MKGLEYFKAPGTAYYAALDPITCFHSNSTTLLNRFQWISDEFEPN